MGNISEFMCPLCGHLHSIRTYDPEDLPLDILGIQKVGLGQGLGTRVVDRFSLLGDDDVTPKIVKRVLTLCRFFLNQKLITMGELKSSLGLGDEPSPGTISLKEHNRLREDYEALVVQIEEERKQTKLQYDRANNLLQIVNSQRGKVSDYDRLREENEALKVDLELEEKRANRESAKAANLQQSVNALRGQVSELTSQLSTVKSSRSALQEQIDEMETVESNADDALDEIIREIEDKMNTEFDEDQDTKEEFIISTIVRLVEDVEALKAENE